MMSRIAVLGAAVLLLGATGGEAIAQAYPSKAVRLISPYPPGGGTDAIARVLAQEMAKDLGASVIVENKAGAGTIVGTQAVVSSEADGYTLLMGTFASAVNSSLIAKLPYDVNRDLAPVALIARAFNIVVVNPKSKLMSVADLVAMAKDEPGKISFGTYGTGTSAHLGGELFKSLAGVRMTAVPYKGSAPAITDLLGGQIEVMFTTVSSAAALIEGGQLRALAVTSAERSPAFPHLPTVAEAGVAGYVLENWYGLFAPAGTPADVIAKLNAAAKKATDSADFRKLLEPEGLTVSAGAPAELDTFVRAETTRWARIVKENNVKAD